MTHAHMVIHFALALVAPPSLAIPTFFAALWGWLAGALVLVLPSAWLAWRSHAVLGHWTRYFAQWRRAAWWIERCGAVALAVGSFAFLGAIPAWQSRWDSWYSQARAQSVGDSDPLLWLNTTQSHLAAVLRIGAITMILLGGIILILGLWRFHKVVLARRTPVAPTTEWMMVPRP